MFIQDLEVGTWFSSLSESGFIPTVPRKGAFIFISHTSSHLFQRVASFLLGRSMADVFVVDYSFSSLSESGFIPTWFQSRYRISTSNRSSHLFQRVASFLLGKLLDLLDGKYGMFSSLSESGFIPTVSQKILFKEGQVTVLISFREWLHSYME